MKSKTKYVVTLLNEPSEEAKVILHEYAFEAIMKLITEKKMNEAKKEVLKKELENLKD